ncbi:WecB/TagA/CpsF family glycosyltransferase [Shewanella pneumatophori]|uniref:WecB/TagA/CpsF family glycosyltransferase n=1 Tax=Shewanella pneumatophori TaxID=314092 RepID=A0A9X2CF32_9GAMM|nr:WecB/TagA/CpsF family glycosyltransferase [Shewanella pneumatophori]MCL1139547.1 WecB/TagA/CpsF family glycosyltransferase [Shewanella pneumatophori]
MPNNPTGKIRTPFSICCFDSVSGIISLVIVSPLMVYGYLRSLFISNCAFESVYIKGSSTQVIELLQFSYNGWYKKLPILLNLIKGDIAIIGAPTEFVLTDINTAPVSDKQKPNQNIKPGLMSMEQLNALTGLHFEDSANALTKAHSNLARYLMAIVRSLVLRAAMALFFSHTPKSSKSISLFGISLNNWTMQQLLDEILLQCQKSSASAVSLNVELPRSKASSANTPSNQSAGMQQYAFINADCLNISTQNEHYRQCLQQSQRIFADGIGLRVACLSKGEALRANLNGTDLFPRLCQLAAQQELSIYMLGGAADVAQTAAQNMQACYPNLKIAGTHHGYFNTAANSQDNQQVIQAINSVNADILLVAMGAPTQELWLAQNKSQLNCAIGIGVGGLFDFYSNRIKRAPLWLRQMGLEWTFRLLQEPTRMWKRYIIGNPVFLYRVWRENRQLKKRITQQSTPQKTNTQQGTPLTDAQLTTQLQAQLGKANRRQAELPSFDCKRANVRRAQFDLAMRCSKAAKRSLDLVGAAILLLLLSPIFALTAIAIKVSSRGPVLYSQPRCGLYNRPFTMWKFRSMYQDADKRLTALASNNEMNGGVIFKMKADPRITFIGRCIRKTSIDELPQLWNVLKGEMSLVGPRPALISEVEQYKQHHRNRLAVKPGITCIWQVSGRSTIPFEQQVELDIEYIYKQSLVADLWLLLKTIPAVIFARGAY